jgi:hypothetical protein
MENEVRKVRYKSRLKYRAVKQAIRESKGIYSEVARRLGCDWHTVDDFIKHHPKLARLVINERETLVDVAEKKLSEKVEAGDNWAIGRVLDGPGKRRDWSVRKEIEAGEKLLDAIDIDKVRKKLAEAIDRKHRDSIGQETDGQ